MELITILNISNTFIFFGIISFILNIAIFFSISFIMYFIIIKHKLLYWLKTFKYLDSSLRTEDELSLIYANKGIENSIFSLWCSMLLSILFYIMI
jgi:hypothetical protein